jgi:hypothetical protein
MDVALLIIIIVLILLLGGGGWYTTRPGYAGPAAGVGNILYILVAILVIFLVLRLLGVV